MNRRRFISLLALGCPATVVAEKLGLVDRIRSYFFAPKGGWQKQNNLFVMTRQDDLLLYGYPPPIVQLSVGMEVPLYSRSGGLERGRLRIDKIEGSTVFFSPVV